MDKKVKNALAAVGAASLVAAVPVLVAGVAIGVVVADPEKAKKVAKEGFEKAQKATQEGLDTVKTFAEEVKVKAMKKEPVIIEDLFSEEEEIPFPEEEFSEEEVPAEEPEAEQSEEDLRTKRGNFIDLLMAICNELKDDA